MSTDQPDVRGGSDTKYTHTTTTARPTMTIEKKPRVTIGQISAVKAGEVLVIPNTVLEVRPTKVGSQKPFAPRSSRKIRYRKQVCALSQS